MESMLHCDPCDLESKTVAAARYCSDCKEHLCTECAEFHMRFKAFRSHHILDLKSLKSQIPKPNKKCETHPGILLEFFCIQHDVTCCRACIADTHRSCDKILPLDVASKDIKTSSLLLDSLSSITDFLATLEKLLKNREDNLNSLKKTKSKIIQQIDNAKIRLIKHLDQLEEKLIAEVSSIKTKGEEQILEHKSSLSAFHVACNQNKQDLEFLREHGSNTQLFLFLRQTVKSMDKNEDEVKRLSSLFTEIDIKFHKTDKIEKNLIGSVLDIKTPGQVEYKPKVLQQAQTQADTIKSPTSFEVDGSVKLKSDDNKYITDITITRTNNLLICYFRFSDPKVYMYKDCEGYVKNKKLASSPYGISAIPGTDKAVITLPYEESIQFISTTDLKKGDKVNIGMEGYGINATKDKVFVGGKGVVKILDRKGSNVNTIMIGSGYIFKSLFYDEDNGHILGRSYEGLHCCKVNGTVLYQYQVSGNRGLAVDRQGNLYVSMKDTNEIHRLTSDGKFRDSVRTTESPSALSFNNDYSKLFVVIGDIMNNITILKCK